MKRRLFYFCFVFAAIGIALLVPQNAESLNPNHQCAFCHDVHGAATPQQLLQYTTVEALCLSCHGPGGIYTLKADVHTKTGEFRITCRQCHEPHSDRDNWCPANCNSLGTGKNIKLVGSKQDGTNLAKINTPNSGIRHVVFESRGGSTAAQKLHSFADGDQDSNGYYDGVCETCHTLTSRHCNTASNCTHTHQKGNTCTTSNCHSHIKQFIP